MVGLHSPPCRSTACSARPPAITARRSAPTRRPTQVLDRTITVRFDANVDPGLPWSFAPVAAHHGGEDRRDRARLLQGDQQVRSAGHRHRHLQRHARAGRHATSPRSNASASPSRRSPPGQSRDAGDVLRRSQDRRGRRHQEHRRDHVVLYVLPHRQGGRALPQRRPAPSRDRDHRTFGGAAPPRVWEERESTMAEAHAHAKQHDYHLVNPSPWPIVGSVGAFALADRRAVVFHVEESRRPAALVRGARAPAA